MKVSVVGTGYVGLVSGVCLADKGHDVVCVDIDGAKVERINKGIPPIYEEGLEPLLKKNLGRRFRASTSVTEAVANSGVTLVAVGTPFDGKKIDLAFVMRVAEEIGACLKAKTAYHTVIVKSTVVPGTTDTIVKELLEQASGKRAGVDFGLGMNPEFLTEGQAIQDFMNPDRIVLGGIDARTIAVLDELYRPFEGVPMIHTNARTAEMIKYASNALLATMISFSNEIANLGSALGGIDTVDVMNGVHLSYYLRPMTKDGSRIQTPISSFLEAGCGYGGSCLPKDVKALIAHGEGVGAPMPLLESVVQTNEKQPDQVIRLLTKHFSSLEKIRVAILGLSFKPDTDDMRESPAVPIIQKLHSQGALLKAYDPVANHEARRLFPVRQLALCESLEEVLMDIDAAVLVTRWKQFDRISELWPSLCPNAVFVDGRRMVDKNSVKKYEGIGL